MSAKSWALLCGLTLAGLAVPAEARFGKRSAESKKSSEESEKEKSSEEGSSPTHAASPVQPARVTPSPTYVAPAYPRRHWSYGWFGARYVPVYYPANPTPWTEIREEPPAAPVRVTVGAEGMAFPGGVSLGLGLSFEGERTGYSVGYHHLTLATDDGSPGVDTIKLLNLHATYAVLANQFGRLRVEGGADSAFAPDLTVMGPSLGLSGVLWVAGPLALEGAVTITPFPFRQMDLRGGLGLGYGALGLRAGWRTLVLDDAGLVDGIVHRDEFSGPYLGLALVF